IGRSVAAGRRDAGVRGAGCGEDSGGGEPGQELRAERAAPARHLRAARLEGVDGLVGLERPALRHVAVADRSSLPFEVALERLGKQKSREPEAGAARGTGGGVWPPPGGQPPPGPRPARPRRGGSPGERGRPRVRRGGPRRGGGGGGRGRGSGGRSRGRGESGGGSVAEVLTTSRSPARRKLGSSSKRVWTIAPAPRLAIISRTRSRRRPRASGGSCASRRAG